MGSSLQVAKSLVAEIAFSSLSDPASKMSLASLCTCKAKIKEKNSTDPLFSVESQGSLETLSSATEPFSVGPLTL